MFLLDSDICVFAMKGHERVRAAFDSTRRRSLFVSAICEAELRAGAAKSQSRARATRTLDYLLERLTVIDFTSADARIYAELRADLERTGKPIGQFDTLIAAQALSRDLTLVTNNEREFSRVRGMRLENWTR